MPQSSLKVMLTILLGEAPKHPGGIAFDYRSWTTEQIAAVVGVKPFLLNRVFFVMNVLTDPQPAQGSGFDRFSREEAVEAIRNTHFRSQRIICLGSRVARAFESELGLERGSIPENRFKRFNRTDRGSGWELARIPHPSALRDNEGPDGLVLPPATQAFLRQAAGVERQTSRTDWW